MGWADFDTPAPISLGGGGFDLSGILGSFGGRYTPGTGILGAMASMPDSLIGAGLGLASAPRGNWASGVARGYFAGAEADARSNKARLEQGALRMALKRMDPSLSDAELDQLSASPAAIQLWAEQKKA